MSQERRYNRRRQRTVTYVDGDPHKRCEGVLHPEGVLLPVESFYPFPLRSGTVSYSTLCRRCQNWRRSRAHTPKLTGLMPLSAVKFAVYELEHRLGRAEAARRTGVHRASWRAWTNGRRDRIHRATAKRLVETLAAVRAEDEVRSRVSIKRGAARRGEPDRRPRSRDDYYSGHPLTRI